MTIYPKSIIQLINDYITTFGQAPPTWRVKERPYSQEWVRARWEEIIAGRQIHLIQPEDAVLLQPAQR